MNIAVPAEALVARLRVRVLWARLENTVCAVALLGMAIVPVLELLLRAVVGTGIPGAVEYTQHLGLWAGFAGAVVAARERQHLSLIVGTAIGPGSRWRVVRWLSATASGSVAVCLAWASFEFVAAESASPMLVGGWLPVWVSAAVLPVAFLLMAVRFILQAGGPIGSAASAACAVTLAAAFLWAGGIADSLVLPCAVLLVGGAAFGLPIFVVLGGIALLLFHGDGVPVAALPVETYRLVVSPSIPAIPLFTLTGFILAHGSAAQRLVRLFRALLGSLPGGAVVATTLACAFFSAFTGASGVTILALGGLLLPVLVQSGTSDRFALGLITSTGSIGLLFPPSLAVILYGVVAEIPIPDLFEAGAVPGLMMVAAIALFGVVSARRGAEPRPVFDRREALAALYESRWELGLPVVVLISLFGGFASLIETAAISTVYAIVVSTCVHRDIHHVRDFGPILVRCAGLLGGVFAIIGVAMGLTNYLVDAMVPMKLVAWVEAHVESRFVFLLALNLLLVVVGCLMDVFSAIFVVLPLIIPASQLFGIEPLHLAIIFLINLEIGYLTPPVGMNLFLASYRLDRPVLEVCRSVLPFLAVLVGVLLLVTFVPALTTGLR
jgi:tripartite ATP-independent transporter DctM subunit